MNDPHSTSRPTPPGTQGGGQTSMRAEREAAAFVQSHGASLGVEEGAGLYRLLVESIRDYAIFVLDPTGRIVSWNPGAERFKGYKAQEIIGRHFSIFYPAERIAERFPQMELEVAAREGRFEDEGWRLRKDGTRFWANVVITALRDDMGVLVGFAKVTRDLTEKRAANERALEDARRLAEADAANRAKVGFLASMSHELRTPLNAIGGYADLLLAGIGGDLTDQQRQYLQRIHGSQQHLLGLINDILNFTRTEAGQVSYDIGPVPLRAVAAAVLPMVEPQASAKELTLTLQPGTEVIAQADRMKVEQVLLNLLSNAVKFTPRGGTVEVRTTRTPDRAVVAVHDTGIGIEADKLPAIFEPFVQVGRTLTSPQEGTGLGLSISRDLARGMRGDLTAESTPGVGSTFTLTLPVS